MTDIDLKEMRKIAEKATPGEWHLHPVDDTCVCSAGNDIATTCDSSNAERGDAYNVDYERMERDAAYIVAAQPKAVLTLLDRLEAAEAERDAARALLKRAGEALAPFAAAANCYDPDENDGDLPVWDFEPKTRELRAARAIHAEIKEAIDD